MGTRRDASRARGFRRRAAISVLLIGLAVVSLPLIARDQVRADSSPGNVQVFANPPGQVCASWSPVDGANSYKLFDGSGNFIANAAVANTPKCFPDVVGTCLMVSAVTSGGETARSAPTCVGSAPSGSSSSGPVTYPTPIVYPTPIPVPTVQPPPAPAPVYSPPSQPVAPAASVDTPVTVNPDPPPTDADPGR